MAEPKKPTARDVPGTGLAKEAAKTIEARKDKNAAALKAANAALGRMREGQTTDSNNRPAR